MASSGKMNPLPSLLRASAQDAGNVSMRKAGRKVWSRADLEAAADELSNLIATCYGEGVVGSIRFGYAEAMQKAGLLTIATKDFFGTFNAAFADYEASFDRVVA